jgi:hypothetical protein
MIAGLPKNNSGEFIRAFLFLRKAFLIQGVERMEDKDITKRGFLHLRNPLKRDRTTSVPVSAGYNWDNSLIPENKSTASKVTLANQVITLEAIPDRTYGDADFNVKVTASSGLPITITASGACSITGINVHINGAGVCTITAHQDGDDNFNTAEDVQQSFMVKPAELTVKADDKRIEYGKPLPSFSATASGLVNGFESLGKLTFTTTAVPGSPPGTYTINPAGLNSPNYTYKYISGILTIAPATVTVVANDKSKIYGEPLPVFDATIAGRVNGDTPESLGNLVFEAEATPGSPVGNYSVTPGGLSLPNYVFNYIKGTLTVSPALLKVKANDKSITFGEPLPVFDGEVTGLVNGDSIESLGELIFTAAAMPGSPVGKYEIIPSGLESPDYSYDYISGTLSITPAPLTVTAESIVIEYGEPLPFFDAAVISRQTVLRYHH